MTRFQLRRLALQATRRPELLPALQDALLESELGPQFEAAIAIAHDRAARLANETRTSRHYPFAAVVIAFNATSTRKYSPFSYHALSATADADWTRLERWFPESPAEARIPVYILPVSTAWRPRA